MASKVVLIGDKVLSKKLLAFNASMANTRIALGRVGNTLVSDFVENFETEGKTLNDNWKPLSAATLVQKQRMGFGSKGILQRTGKLKKSIKMLRLNKYLVEVGSKLNYYKYHQSTAPRNKLPRRKMVDITAKISKKIMTILREHITLPLIK